MAVQAITRVAIVTGAARGIGRAIALRLSNDGYDIVANDVPARHQDLENLVAEICADGKRKSLAVTGDVSKESNVEDLVNTAVEKLGGLDVMVANAGIAHSNTLISTTVEEWDHVHAVNARSVFLCYKAAAIQMIKQGRGGRIIGACSNSGKRGLPEWGTYAASKFAVRALTQSASAELREHNITVNAYAPGLVDTPLLDDINKKREDHGLKHLSNLIEWNLLQPEDVAGLVSYLVKDESRFVTGQTVCINGGTYCD